ncbi:MAG TPA: rhomboid family intramembrane serine protease [Bdellovibrio sp.]|nr:rhomboid family intramembrane serine protease [Bdellovibrio sp.]
MFLFPLGLSSRLVIIPWATLLVLGATFYLSIEDFKTLPLLVRSDVQARKELHLKELTHHALIDLCKRELTPSDCVTIKSYLSERPAAQADKEMPRLLSWLQDKNTLLLEGKEESLLSLDSYKELARAQKAYEEKKLQIGKKNNSLMRGNASPVTAFLALFRHGGWEHLIGNMVILAVFAVFVEQRVGPLWFLLIYFLGGVASNMIQAPFLERGVPLIGASGAVSAVMGAFAFYFWRQKMAVVMSIFFAVNKRILISAPLYIGFFFVLNEFASMIGPADTVAHLAHLAGFAFGFLVGAFQFELAPLKEHFIFRQEQNLFFKWPQTSNLSAQVQLISDIYRLNHENFFAFSFLFARLHKLDIPLFEFSLEEQMILVRLVQESLNYNGDIKNLREAYNVVRHIPQCWDLNSMALSLNRLEVLKKEKLFRQNQEPDEADRIGRLLNGDPGRITHAAS